MHAIAAGAALAVAALLLLLPAKSQVPSSDAAAPLAPEQQQVLQAVQQQPQPQVLSPLAPLVQAGTTIGLELLPGVRQVTLAGAASNFANDTLVKLINDPKVSAVQVGFDEAQSAIDKGLTVNGAGPVGQGALDALKDVAKAPVQVAQLANTLRTGVDSQLDKVVPGLRVDQGPLGQAGAISNAVNDAIAKAAGTESRTQFSDALSSLNKTLTPPSSDPFVQGIASAFKETVAAPVQLARLVDTAGQALQQEIANSNADLASLPPDPLRLCVDGSFPWQGQCYLKTSAAPLNGGCTPGLTLINGRCHGAGLKTLPPPAPPPPPPPAPKPAPPPPPPPHCAGGSFMYNGDCYLNTGLPPIGGKCSAGLYMVNGQCRGKGVWA